MLHLKQVDHACFLCRQLEDTCEKSFSPFYLLRHSFSDLMLKDKKKIKKEDIRSASFVLSPLTTVLAPSRAIKSGLLAHVCTQQVASGSFTDS